MILSLKMYLTRAFLLLKTSENVQFSSQNFLFVKGFFEFYLLFWQKNIKNHVNSKLHIVDRVIWLAVDRKKRNFTQNNLCC